MGYIDICNQKNDYVDLMCQYIRLHIDHQTLGFFMEYIHGEFMGYKTQTMSDLGLKWDVSPNPMVDRNFPLKTSFADCHHLGFPVSTIFGEI